MSKRSPRLLFTDEEMAAPELKKAIRKADKRMKKLEKAEAKIPKDNWKDEFAELYAALTPEEYAAARASTLNAHYTSPTVIKKPLLPGSPDDPDLPASRNSKTEKSACSLISRTISRHSRAQASPIGRS